MKKMITHKNIVIFSILISIVFISNCSTDQNVTGYTDSENLSVSKINTSTIAYEDLILDGEEIEIQVSPSILNLASNSIVVTIHTDISYSTVDASTVTLNDITIQSWKSDNRGFFVAKFEMDAVKNIVTVGYNTLTLGLELTNSDELLSCSSDVLIINKSVKS